mmetsp:Transcript_3702/g.6327  ORF Transcript_3702/g.6327 Transcript_3702/m.6327 type:complete len:92 (+) Transcript_3702:2-277(+)
MNDTLAAFEAAAQAAQEMQFLQQEAIAYERAACFLSGKSKALLTKYSEKALLIYLNWGAYAKVQMLAEKFGMDVEEVRQRHANAMTKSTTL